jgi:hypothetical protein
MTTETTNAPGAGAQTTPPPAAQTEEAYVLPGFRKRKKSGMPTSGIFVLNGDPKTSKTTLMASFPDSIVLNLDTQDADYVDGRIVDIEAVPKLGPNGRQLVEDGVPVWKHTKLAHFRIALGAAIKDPSIKVIGIDTLDTLAELLATEIANANNLEKITDRAPGVDGFQMYSDLAKKIDTMIGAFKRSGKLIILSAHRKPAKLDDNNKIVAPAGINVTGKGGEKILFASDLIGETMKLEVGGVTTYHLSFLGGVATRGGSRVEELADKVIRLDKKNPYQSFAAVFEKTEAAPAAAKTDAAAPKAAASTKTKAK